MRDMDKCISCYLGSKLLCVRPYVEIVFYIKACKVDQIYIYI